MPKRILPVILTGFLMVVLTLPLLNMLTGVVESGKLMGSVNLAGDTRLSLSGWFDGSYQQKKEAYVNDNIGFRPDLIRVTNQMDYLAFRKLHQEDVILGKDGYLHSEGYVKALNGDDFMGRDSIRTIMRRLRFIRDSLQRAGKPLIFAFLPSKARLYPETLPERYRKPPTHLTNYEVMLAEAKAQGIHTVDFNGWYLQMKPTAPHPLFTRQGIHWTRWSADHAADSLNRFMEPLLHADLPDMRFGDMRCGPKPEDGEDDIAQALNLIWPITTDTFCYYNNIDWDFDSTRMRKPSIIFISDSFFWTWVHDGLAMRAYEDWEFWFYFNELWDQKSVSGNGERRDRQSTDWLDIIRRKDAVVLFFTEANLSNPCITTFVNETYKAFGGK